MIKKVQKMDSSRNPNEIFLSLSLKAPLFVVLILIASLAFSSCKRVPPTSPITTTTPSTTSSTTTSLSTTTTTASTTTTTEPSTTTTTTPGTTTSSTSSSTTTSTGTSTTTSTPTTTTTPTTSTTTTSTGTSTTTSTPTTTTTPTTSTTTTIGCIYADEIDVALNPATGKNDDFIDVQISISENCTPIDAFGLDMTFDPNVFSYVSTSTGDLTESFGFFGGNEISSGIVRVGGAIGIIPAGSSGQIATVRLKVACDSCINGTSSVIQIQSYTDDIAAMSPQPASTSFTYQALLLFPKIIFFP